MAKKKAKKGGKAKSRVKDMSPRKRVSGGATSARLGFRSQVITNF